MFGKSKSLLLLLLLAFPAISLFRAKGFGAAQAVGQSDAEDELIGDDEEEEEDEDEDEADVQDEDEVIVERLEDVREGDGGDLMAGEPMASANADTTIMFVRGEEFPANRVVKFMVGFTNKGPDEFVVEYLDASFRYPQDFQFYIQNFSALPLNVVVLPRQQASFEYSFIPAEPMGGRPFGLVINLSYRDGVTQYRDAVFNQTVTVTEPDEGLDGEMFFMYLFLGGLLILLLVVVHQLMEARKKRRPTGRAVEMGTTVVNGVDMSWIPQETLDYMNKNSPRRSPRKRISKRAVGTDE
uniref:translocon-associated protein subunit alpha isoform X2 n=1 Tax=Myxine glutinosa TaxID=7769 RepID=UPI00358FC78C